MSVSMFSSICSFSGFVFIIAISRKCVVGWFWVALGLGLGICLGSSNKGDEGSGDGSPWKFVWNELNDGGSSGVGSGIKLSNVAGDGGGKDGPVSAIIKFVVAFS